MVQESELINLVLGIISIVLILSVFWKHNLSTLRPFYIAFFFIFSAYIATVIEGLLWPRFFNILEHALFTSSSIAFVIGCRSLAEQFRHEKEEQI
jgi:putative Mn2+ efflux pump MntP